MIHEYNIKGITCASCIDKVRDLIGSISGIKNVNLDMNGKATVEMETHVPLSQIAGSLRGTAYTITEINDSPEEDAETISWSAYRPVFLIFAYITGVSLVVEYAYGIFNAERWMSNFMAGFFLTFSFFKMLDLPAFASSYSTYDIIAKRLPSYGYVYPFIELFFGIAFLIPPFHSTVSWMALIIMSVSLAGVIQSLLRKTRFQCACLGAFFKVPLSRITLIEDALMVVMSLVMILI